MNSIYIIAEAGVNHNGSSEKAFQLVDAAVNAGADAVKFQTFNAEKLVTKNAEKAEYQRKVFDVGESQFDMLKRLELSCEVHRELVEYCAEKNIAFLSSAFDIDSLRFLVDDLELSTLKIPSGEITNGPLLLEHAMTGCDLILSTGMTTLGEVEEALGVIAFGLLDSGGKPSRAAFQEAYFSKQGWALLKKKVTVLHCTTEYPAPVNEINLNAMNTMQQAFGLNVGYSDHSEGIVVPIAASSMGATVIEKHFTLDKKLPGPDHKASLGPEELKDMISAIRMVEQMKGSGIKEVTPSEIKNRKVVRKSLVARELIRIGDQFTEQNVTIKRPGTGISPMDYWEVLKSESTESFLEDELIS